MDRIYDLHQAAFKAVEAYVIMRGVELVGRVAFKRGATGKVWCYLHIFGAGMTRGAEGGGGYDKASSAFYKAAMRIFAARNDPKIRGVIGLVQTAARDGAGSSTWARGMGDSGFTIHQAV